MGNARPSSRGKLAGLGERYAGDGTGISPTERRRAGLSTAPNVPGAASAGGAAGWFVDQNDPQGSMEEAAALATESPSWLVPAAVVAVGAAASKLLGWW